MSQPRATHEILVGLNVLDDAGYRRYREGMTPLLEACGGSFRYDFRVSEVLKSETGEPINRLFVIVFPDITTKERFFSDPEYLAIRARHFEPAVREVTRIASYDRAGGA